MLFINPGSGGGKAARRAGRPGARHGDRDRHPRPGQDLAALAGDAAAGGADMLGMAGGDGSLAVVAAVAAAHGIPFACVPAGTRNHFALDVGVDRHDLTGALDAFTGGVERQIDTAEVNGRMFLNNVSLGIYGDAVRSPAYRDAKVLTLLETAAEVMGPGAEAPALDPVDDLGREHRHPVIVLVSNNPYALNRPLARGTRPALDSGQLGIVVLDAPGDSPRVPGRAWSAPGLEINAPDLHKVSSDPNSASIGAIVTRAFTASASCRSSVIKASASSWVRATYSASNVSDQPSWSATCHAAF
jgi:diacylglycerol kinase family enzyme